MQFFHHIVWNDNNFIKLANLKFEAHIWETQMCLMEPDKGTVAVIEHCNPIF